MFDLFEMLNYGREINAHGEKWISIQYLANGFYLAIRKEEKFPCQVFVVKEEIKQ